MRLRYCSLEGSSGSVLAASAGALLTGCAPEQPTEKAAEPAPSATPAPPTSGLSPDLAVVQKSKGTVMTVLVEFYKMGPGPSSSHTMGLVRITYDFFERVSKLPEDQLKRATALKVHLFGSLSATGKGHGTDRASLAGLLGKAPATCPPEFLDGLAANPDDHHGDGPDCKGNELEVQGDFGRRARGFPRALLASGGARAELRIGL